MMTESATLAQSGKVSATPVESEMRWRSGWLRIARGAWLLVATGVIVNFLVGIPAYYTQLSSVCTIDPTQCSFNNLPTPANVQALHQLGLSLRAFATISTCLVVAVTLIDLGLGR